MDDASGADAPILREFFAHSANAYGRWHPLREHLLAVSGLAEEFAPPSFHDEARLAGLLHDLGKYGELFQARLRGEERGLDHWTAGAWVAATEPRFRSLAASLAIEGHHVGLQPGSPMALGKRLKAAGELHPMALRLSDPNHPALMRRAEADGLCLPSIAQPLIQRVENGNQVGTMLDVRMLFSCLVDADFLDTESHFEGDAHRKVMRASGPRLEDHLELAASAIQAFLQRSVRASASGSAEVRAIRDELWDALTNASQKEPGLFTLTAPTGSGKTLAMLQFALQHARRHGLRRVVLAVPYLSIIEQTAKIYRCIFSELPSQFTLEHHSLAGLGTELSQGDAEPSPVRGDEERQRRLLAENWDAPIVITTNVQILESLFSNRPSACRKLHRLMESVLIFDEAQSLPQALTVPTLAALSHLSQRYGSSVVFSTATQPAFDHLDVAVTKYAHHGWRPTELVPNHPAMFHRLRRRVSVHWPQDGETTDWTSLAATLRGHRQVLCVVNLKRHAEALVEQLSDTDGVLHLSTNLCTAHRREVLDEVRRRLSTSGNAPCRLVATQCIEAGVDVDFPHVYRALAPLEAIAQAAGRCNREGRIAAGGNVHVFEPAKNSTSSAGWRGTYPTFSYYQAAEVAKSLGQPDINDPEVFKRYYRKLFDIVLPESQNPALTKALAELDFPEVAKLYRLIDTDAIQVVVPWIEATEQFEQLRKQALQGIDRHWMHKAQALAVAVFRPKRSHPLWSHLMPVKLRSLGGKAESDEWFILQDPHREDPDRCVYHHSMGLRPPEADAVLIA